MSEYGLVGRERMKAKAEDWKPTNRKQSDFPCFMRFWLWGMAGLIATALLIFGLDKLFGCFR